MARLLGAGVHRPHDIGRTLMSAETLARRNGSCTLCPEPVIAGQSYIAKVDPIGWVHSHCGQSYKRVIDEHEPTADQPHREDAS
jgi:hypothetical protein